MRSYKLWIEIEELDLDTGEQRSLTDDGEVSPVPIAQFSDLGSAVRFAEALAMDDPIAEVSVTALLN